MKVTFYNEVQLVMSAFAIEWNGGNSARTAVIGFGESVTIDTEDPQQEGEKIPDGTSCWARAYVQAAPNHDSSDNFTYHATAGPVEYTLTGTLDDTSFSCQGCS